MRVKIHTKTHKQKSQITNDMTHKSCSFPGNVLR